MQLTKTQKPVFQNDFEHTRTQCLEVFEKYFLFFGPMCNFKYRKMISTNHLPQTLLFLTKFKILEFWLIISKLFEPDLLSKLVLLSKPKSLRYQMFPEVFQRLLNRNLVESSNLEPPVFDPSWSIKIFTFFGSPFLHFSTVIWPRFEKV